MRKFNDLLSVIFVTFALQSYAASIYDPGIQYCQMNPAVCGLENYGSFERGRVEARQACQQNPNSCGLEPSGSFENGKNQGIQQGISQCQQNPSSCKIPLPILEMKPRAPTTSFNDPELFVYLSPQGFAGNKQNIFEMGMDSWYVYQLISRPRKTTNDPFIFDLQIVNGLQ